MRDEHPPKSEERIRTEVRCSLRISYSPVGFIDQQLRHMEFSWTTDQALTSLAFRLLVGRLHVPGVAWRRWPISCKGGEFLRMAWPLCCAGEGVKSWLASLLNNFVRLLLDVSSFGYLDAISGGFSGLRNTSFLLENVQTLFACCSQEETLCFLHLEPEWLAAADMKRHMFV